MKKYVLLAAFAILVSVFTACDDDPVVPEGNVQVNVYGKMTDPNVSMVTGKINGQAGPDSIHVTSIKILVSRISLHPVNEGDANESVIHTAPAIFVATDSEVPHLITSDEIPEGNFDRLKFEIHGFTPTEVTQYANDPLFGTFATSERNTVIITGLKYSGGLATNFTVNSSLTDNLNITPDSNLNLFNKDSANIVVEIDNNALFINQGQLLDPSDSGIINKINIAIKNAIKVYLQ